MISGADEDYVHLGELMVIVDDAQEILRNTSTFFPSAKILHEAGHHNV